MTTLTSHPRSGESKRNVLLLELERGRSLAHALRDVRWSSPAYWTQRHRHRDWAHEVDRAIERSWRSGAYGRGVRLDGRAMRGAYQRRCFLEGLRGGKLIGQVRREMNWSGPAYRQARYRHREWAAEVDRLHWHNYITQLQDKITTQP